MNTKTLNNMKKQIGFNHNKRRTIEMKENVQSLWNVLLFGMTSPKKHFLGQQHAVALFRMLEIDQSSILISLNDYVNRFLNIYMKNK
jgi:hypothetical protein